jgi:cold shock CspA family protein
MKFASFAAACAFVATAAVAQTSTGVVTTFDPNKGGPGFIKADGSGTTLIFMPMDITAYPWRTVKPGDKVTFNVVKGTQGDKAANVALIPPSTKPASK